MNYIQKYMAALKLNRWPMVDYVKQAEQEQQDKVNRLYPKKNDIILSDLCGYSGRLSTPIGVRETVPLAFGSLFFCRCHAEPSRLIANHYQ